MEQIQDVLPQALGDLGSRNPVPTELREWIEACGRHMASQGKVMAIIVADDHLGCLSPWRCQWNGPKYDL
jgi:hypothetical protein